MSEPRDARTVGAQVDALLADLAQLAEPPVVGKVDELVRTLVEFYGAGLARAVQVLTEADDGGTAVRRLADDELVGGLLILHDLHPDSTADRVAAALEQVRPYLGSHAGDVDLLGVDGDVVRLRLAGSCHGCPSSTVTVKLAIEQAIARLAPEIARVDVEGVVPEQPSTPTGPGGRRLLPLATDVPAEPESPPSQVSWVDVAGTAEIPAGALVPTRIADQDTVLCRVDDALYAYRNRCPGCTGQLSGGTLDGSTLTCPTCARSYDVRQAGRGDGEHLDPLPLLSDAGAVRVAVPGLVAS